MAVPLNMRNDIRPMGADGVPRAEITPRWRTCRRRLRRPPRGRGRPRRATGRGCPPSRRPACQRRASGATPRVPDSGGHRALPRARGERGGPWSRRASRASPPAASRTSPSSHGARACQPPPCRTSTGGRSPRSRGGARARSTGSGRYTNFLDTTSAFATCWIAQ